MTQGRMQKKNFILKLADSDLRICKDPNIRDLQLRIKDGNNGDVFMFVRPPVKAMMQIYLIGYRFFTKGLVFLCVLCAFAV